MKRILAGIVTLALLAVVVWFRNPAPSSTGTQQDSPVACVDRMFLAASRGDVETYVACFTGVERQQMERSLSQEAGVSAIESLRGTVAELKGWAVMDPPENPDAISSCALVVERIYAGRVDRQRMELRREAGGWRIAAVDRSQATQPSVAYGTPVYALEAAGPESATK